MYNPPLDLLDGSNVLALYDEGVPMSWIAAYTGRRVSTVQAWLSRRGHHEPRRRVAHERVVGLYDGPATIRAIADRLGIDRTAVHAHARRAGRRRAGPGVDEAEHARMVELYTGGANVHRVALAVGRHWRTVRAHLVAAGVYDPARAARARAARPTAHPWRRENEMWTMRSRARRARAARMENES